jgi:hypothetical protein
VNQCVGECFAQCLLGKVEFIDERSPSADLDDAKFTSQPLHHAVEQLSDGAFDVEAALTGIFRIACVGSAHAGDAVERAARGRRLAEYEPTGQSRRAAVGADPELSELGFPCFGVPAVEVGQRQSRKLAAFGGWSAAVISVAASGQDVVNLGRGELHIAVADPDVRGELNLTVLGEIARLLQA